MKFIVKDMDIATGGTQIIILNQKDAALLDLHHMDRIKVQKKKKQTIAVLDIAESEKAVPPGHIGMFEETLDASGAKDGDIVDIELDKKPESMKYIKKKMDGKILTFEETKSIIQDIVDNRLTDIELTSYVIANYTQELTTREIVDLTKTIKLTGDRFNIKCPKGCGPIVDLHSIGGVPGNRITMLSVPIAAASGLACPKTSSRAITSPSGTADTMEVLCSVSHSINKLQKIIQNVGAFIVWGGAVNLAPADDKIIKVESPLSIDAEGQMIASIMAKKSSVGAQKLVMEIPIGKGTKMETKKRADHLSKHFGILGKELRISTKCYTTDGTQPVGNGIGPCLEAKDCLLALMGDKRAPQDLIKKSLFFAEKMLNIAGKQFAKNSRENARKIFESGRAYEKMCDIIKAQGGRKITNPDKIKISKHYMTIKSQKSGRVNWIDNLAIAKIARLAGAPRDPCAGIYLHVHRNDKVKKGDPLFNLYAESHQKLEFAFDAWEKIDGIVVR